jgi:formate hydrogenlyase subunit 4
MTQTESPITIDTFADIGLEISRSLRHKASSPSSNIPSVTSFVPVVLCSLLLLIDMIIPLFVFASRNVTESVTDLVLLGTTVFAGILGALTGFLFGSYRNFRGK